MILPKIISLFQKLRYRNVTHCIFDLDGTILDTEVVYNVVTSSILSQHNIPYKQELHMKLLGATTKDICKIFLEAGVRLSLKECIKKFETESARKVKDCTMKPGVERLIKHLNKHRVPMAIATSSSQEEFDLKMAKLTEIKKLFHHIVTGYGDPDVKKGKPAPDIYLVCAQRFCEEVKPEDVLVFEDAPNGVTGARAAGMQVVMIPESWTPKAKWKHATLVLKTMERFKPELFGLPKFD